MASGPAKPTSQKRIEANRRNALKSTGPKSPEGKATVRRNALKHALCAREVVISGGVCTEDQAEFDALFVRLHDDLQPAGALEFALVEDIAICRWRRRRLLRFENGTIRHQVDSGIRSLRETYRLMGAIPPADSSWGVALLLEWLGAIRAHVEAHGQLTTQHRGWMKERFGWTSDATASEGPNADAVKALILQRLDAEADKVKRLQPKLQEAERPALEIMRARGALPKKAALDKLLRYEAMNDRQLYRAINQLERLQRQRKGDFVPAPIKIDLGGVA